MAYEFKPLESLDKSELEKDLQDFLRRLLDGRHRACLRKWLEQTIGTEQFLNKTIDLKRSYTKEVAASIGELLSNKLDEESLREAVANLSELDQSSLATDGELDAKHALLLKCQLCGLSGTLTTTQFEMWCKLVTARKTIHEEYQKAASKHRRLYRDGHESGTFMLKGFAYYEGQSDMEAKEVPLLEFDKFPWDFTLFCHEKWNQNAELKAKLEKLGV